MKLSTIHNEKWTMPEWMEPYRSLMDALVDDKYSIEYCMEVIAAHDNLELLLMQVSVITAVNLLEVLHSTGLLVVASRGE